MGRHSRGKRYKKRVNLVLRTHFINVVVMFFLFVGITAFLLFGKRPTESQIEKRKLAEFPKLTVETLTSGEFTDGVSSYFNDTVPLRDTFKKWTSSLLSLRGIRQNDIVIYEGTGPQAQEAGEAGETESAAKPQSKPTSSAPAESKEPSEQEGSETSSESSSQPESSAESESSAEESSESSAESSEVENEPVPEAVGQFEANGAILVVEDRAMEMFFGLDDVTEAYAATMNAYKDDLGPNVNVYEMTIPVSVGYYIPSNYADYTVDPKVRIDQIGSLLNDDVVHVDIYDKLAQHKKEDIYFRTDHHWTLLGAYYGGSVFAEKAGVPYPELSAYEKEVSSGYVGTMYAFTQDPVLLNNPEDFVMYKPRNEYHVSYYSPSHEPLGYDDILFFPSDVSNLYASIMGSDTHITEIETDVKNGRKLVIFKDSFGNALVPFLINSFEEISVVDMRYFDLNAIDYITERGATDVLFADCVFTACGGNRAEEIRVQ